MTREKIGEAAGRVWETLAAKGEIGLSQLPRIAKLKSDVTYQALGWLAREDKIQYRSRDGKVYISLSDGERQHHKSVN